MDDDWIAADLEILDSISHCDETFTSAKKLKSHKKVQKSINHQISITLEGLQLIVKLTRKFLEKIGNELPKKFLDDNSKLLKELILSYRRKPVSSTFYRKHSSMCEEACRIFNLPQEVAAVVLIKVMDAMVKANSTMHFEVNDAGLDERESGRPLFAACETKKTANFLAFLSLFLLHSFNYQV